MNMSTWAIRNPVPVLALFLVLCAAGLVSFTRLPITQFPNVDLPIITVTIAQPGAAPLELTSQVIQPVEDAISNVSGLRHITSKATDSSAVITVEFELETDSDRALNDVKDAVSSVRSDLPDAISEPIIKRLDVTGRPIMTYAVSDPSKSIEDLSYFVDDVVTRELQNVDGVGKISRVGGADREIKVELEPDRLLSLGITASDVSRQLRATNIDLGGGRGNLAGQEYTIRALGGADTVRRLAATPLALSNGRTVRLDQLGEVVDGPSDVREFAMYDGRPVVAFAVFRATGKSDITASRGVRAKLDSVLEKYPNVEFSLIDDATVYTEGNYDSAMETLYEGAVLAIIVVLIFLRNWRATLITAVALPLSAIPTFFVMDMLGFSLNTVSLLGITLVTGILVDDAIVEIENIVRHIKMGAPAYQASEEAASEIGLTVIAISFSIVAVFAPVSFMGGIAGQYFKQFGLTVAVAVLFSLLVARLVTPMMAAYFLKGEDGPAEHGDGVVMRSYLEILGWTLRHRTITLILGIIIFAVSIYSATLLPTEFTPTTDVGRTAISIELPPGSTLDDTRVATREVSRRLLTIPEVTNVFVDGGYGDVTKANITVNYGQRSERERTAVEIERDIDDELRSMPDMRAFLLKPNGQRDVQIIVMGDSVEAAAAAANRLAGEMSKVAGLTNVSNAAALTRPEIQITPKPELAAQLGITSTALATTIRIATIGDTDANLAKFNTGERQIPITVRMKEEVRKDLFKMASQRIPTTRGKPVPLGVVADIAFSNSPSTIERYDQRYQTKVEADLRDGALLGPVLKDIHALPTARDMPEGTEIRNAGDAEIMAEVFSSFGLAMGSGILLVYIVLVLLFSSFITPMTILLSLPLAVGGAIVALFLTDRAISLPVVIGFLMLMGIVTKNAIMLVEFAIESMAGGRSREAAMLDAGHKRARPIVMTTIAMTAGMVPSALALGTGGEFRSPMAIAVIGGLLVSTLLSLLFVPSLFSVIDAGKVGARRLLVRMLGNEQPRSAGT
ncbi:MAG: efflux RND transporter permease subunit [Rhodobiaceae bacterium]|nr:efflux RND transporter permease subunit [Rhodobiaceae bacterium]